MLLNVKKLSFRCCICLQLTMKDHLYACYKHQPMDLARYLKNKFRNTTSAKIRDGENVAMFGLTKKMPSKT